MSMNRYSKGVLESLGFGMPLRVSSIHTDMTQDSGYGTDLGQQSLPVADDAISVSTQSLNRLSKSKPYQCTICTGDKSFTTINDLARHMKTVHAIFRKGDKVWICPAKGCPSVGKQWPRYDNFRQHVVKQHGHEYDHNLEQTYIIIMEDQIGKPTTSSSRAFSHKHGITAGRNQFTRSPLTNFEPEISDGRSETSSDQDVFSDAIGCQQQSPRASSIARHSPSTSTTSTKRKVQSYAFRLAPTTTEMAVAKNLQQMKPASKISSTARDSQAEELAVLMNYPIVPPTASIREIYDDADSFEKLFRSDDNGSSQDSFLEQYDTYVRPSWARSPELAAVGSSFASQSESSLTNTDGTRNTSSTRTSVDQLDGVQQNVKSLELPLDDFQMFSDAPTLFTASRREPVPQLRITDSPLASIGAQSTSVCCQQSQGGTQLVLRHRCSQGYSPETMRSSLSEGEKSFIYYEAIHDTDEFDNHLTPLEAAFADDLAKSVLELYLDARTLASSQESSRSGGPDRQPSSSRKLPQSSNGTNGSRKRSRDDETDPNKTPSGGKNEDNEGEDSNPGGESDNKRAKTDTGVVCLACPFYKNDPFSHRQCAIVVLKGIPVLKQHLYRNHKRPEHYCIRCCKVFPNQDGLDEHQLAADRCVAVANRFADKMKQDACKAIKKRERGTIKNLWFGIYEILFPGQTRPRSHLVDDQAAVLHVFNIFTACGPEAVERISQNRSTIPAPSQAVFDQALQMFAEHYSGLNESQSSHILQAPPTPQQHNDFRTPETMPFLYTALSTQDHANMTRNQVSQTTQLGSFIYPPNDLQIPERRLSTYSAASRTYLPNMLAAQYGNLPLFNVANLNVHPQLLSSPINVSTDMEMHTTRQSSYTPQRQVNTMDAADGVIAWAGCMNTNSMQPQLQSFYRG